MTVSREKEKLLDTYFGSSKCVWPVIVDDERNECIFAHALVRCLYVNGMRKSKCRIKANLGKFSGESSGVGCRQLLESAAGTHLVVVCGCEHAHVLFHLLQ